MRLIISKETKTLLTAFAAHKLTKDFPNNIGELDLTLGTSSSRESR